MFKREWKNIDRVLLGTCILITIISLCIIGSATHINKGVMNYGFAAKQAGAFVIDLAVLLTFCRYDYRKLKNTVSRCILLIYLCWRRFSSWENRPWGRNGGFSWDRLPYNLLNFPN